MRRSVETHSLFVAAPPGLKDRELVGLGAGHFQGGCAPCHGAPGQRSNPIVDRMLPPPPSLTDVVDGWSDKELFWIVRNGIKYTGMPAWVSLDRTDEVWAVVAFLRALPTMTPEDYLTITRSDVTNEKSEGGQVRSGGEASAIRLCARCHGFGSVPPATSRIPVIAAQSPEYLENALHQYADGRRESGIMQPVAAELKSETISQLAQYYSALPALQAKPTSATREQILRGQTIAAVGLAGEGVPACLVCHAGATSTFPTLAGQHSAYTANQLQLWQRGLRQSTAHGAIMAPIARRLNEQQIDDVAAFFHSLGTSSPDGETEVGTGAAP